MKEYHSIVMKMLKRRNFPTTDVLSILRRICQYFRSDKNKLHSLNGRLVNYIEHVRVLEKKNDRIIGEIRSANDWSKIKMMYERELAHVRKTLDQTAFDKAKLEINIARLIEENEYYQQTLRMQCDRFNMARANEEYFCDLQNKYNLLCLNYEKSLNNANEMRNKIDQLNRQLDERYKAFEIKKLARMDSENAVQRSRTELALYDQVTANESRVSTKRPPHGIGNGDNSWLDVVNGLRIENERLKFIIVDAEAQLRTKNHRIYELENQISHLNKNSAQDMQKFHDLTRNLMVPFEKSSAIHDRNQRVRLSVSSKSMVVRQYYRSNQRVSIASSPKYKHMKNGYSRFAQSLQRFKIILKLLDIGKITETRIFVELKKMKNIYFQR